MVILISVTKNALDALQLEEDELGKGGKWEKVMENNRKYFG